nr:hypothetical protein [Tanacetum cinerariifolium]
MVKNIEPQWNIEADKGVSVKYSSGTNNGQQHVALSAIQNVAVQQVSSQGMITSPNTSGVQELVDTFATAAYVIRESPHNTCTTSRDTNNRQRHLSPQRHKGSKSNALGIISYRRLKMVKFCHELGVLFMNVTLLGGWIRCSSGRMAMVLKNACYHRVNIMRRKLRINLHS